VVHAIAAPKTTFRVFLSINGAIFINWLPPGEKINSANSCEKMLRSLSEILHSRRAAPSARPILHFGNGARHRSAVTEKCFENCEFRHARQPPHSADISRCNFSIRDLKTKVQGEEFEMMEELQGQDEKLLGEVTSDTMRRVYEHWIERLNQVI
jgi:hypothetical protein